MKEIKALPELEWCARAKKQMNETDPAALLATSQVAYQIGNAAIVGLIYTSMLGPPWLWFALADNVSFGDLIDLRRAQEKIPKGTLTSVELGDEIAIRFATFYGFRPTGQKHKNGDSVFAIMRKA